MSQFPLGFSVVLMLWHWYWACKTQKPQKLMSWVVSFNPNLGGLFRGSFWGGRGRGVVKITPLPIPYLKLVRIMLKTSNLARKYTRTYVVSENIPFSIKALLILLMSAFFFKKAAFSSQNSTFTQSNSVRVVPEIFWFCFQFL